MIEIIKVTGDEISVRLEEDAYARVRVSRRVLQHSGCVHIVAEAYQVDAQGILCVDAMGAPIKASFGHTMSAADSSDAAMIAASVRSAVAVVLGEVPELETWAHDVHAEARRNGSLRGHLAAHAHTQGSLSDIFASQ